MINASDHIAAIHPSAWINACEIGANTNCPNEPPALMMPAALPRPSTVRWRAAAPISTEKLPAPAPIAADPAGCGWPLARAMRTSTFWMLGAAFSATWIPVFVPLVHLVPFARDLGYSPLTGAWVVSTLGIGAVAGRLVMGGVSDRIGRWTAVGIAMVLQGIAFLGFLLAGRGVALLFGTALVFGYSYGAISTLFPAIVGDFFGRGQAGALVGFLFALAGAMAGWGPLIAGAIYDATGGYDLTWMAAACLNVLALALLALSRPPRELSA